MRSYFRGDDYYIERVIELALNNVAEGGRPFACLIVNNTTGEILAEAANRVAQTGDPTAHAEIVAIRDASAKLRERNARVDGKNGMPGEDMKGHNFYILTNPCAMCAGAMAYCGADEIIHATNRSEYSKFYRDDRRHVDMDTFSIASHTLCASQPVRYKPDPRAIEVYKEWGKRNIPAVELDAVASESDGLVAAIGGSAFFKEIPARRPEKLGKEGLMIPVWRDSPELETLLKTTSRRHLSILAYRGDSKKNVFRDMRELNALAREHYARFIADLGMHIRPLIISSDYEHGFQGVGGTFTLYHKDGSTEAISPTPPGYEMFKSLSHVTLGLSSIVAPFFECPTAEGWQDNLRVMLNKIKMTRKNFLSSGLDATVIEHVVTMLDITSEYIENSLEINSVDKDNFAAYTQRVLPFIHRSMANAARIQVEADMPALLAWKKKLGDQWKDVFVLIPTVWPVSGDNPRERMFTFLLPNPETQIIKTQNQSSATDLMTTLGRVVGDRAIAATVFGAETPFARDSQLALSTSRDLVSSACADAMLAYFHEHPGQIDSLMHDLTPDVHSTLREHFIAAPMDEINSALVEFYARPLSARAFGNALMGDQAAGHAPVSGCPVLR